MNSTVHNYQTCYTLNKEHYRECFEESASLTPKTWRRFIKAGALMLLGFFFYATQLDRMSNHLGQFFFILAFVDVLSVLYARAWWVTRQMLSKASGSEVKIDLDEQGIAIDSFYVKQQFLWQEIQSFAETEKGLVLRLQQAGQYYLSRAHFSEEAWQFMLTKLAEK